MRYCTFGRFAEWLQQPGCIHPTLNIHDIHNEEHGGEIETPKGAEACLGGAACGIDEAFGTSWAARLLGFGHIDLILQPSRHGVSG